MLSTRPAWGGDGLRLPVYYTIISCNSNKNNNNDNIDNNNVIDNRRRPEAVHLRLRALAITNTTIIVTMCYYYVCFITNLIIMCIIMITITF